MKAAYIQQPGPPDSILFGDLPMPSPTGAQVLVKVGAVSLNPIDTYIRAGLVKMDLPKPFIVGCDLAGVVQAVGPAATRLKPGDRVWCSNQGLLGRQGTFAEFAAVEECWLHPTPPSVSDEQAAAMALVGITAHIGLVHCTRLQPGEIVLVQGGAGGVGSTVIQMALALGARVLATAGSEEKIAACLQLGAVSAFNYKTQNLTEAVKQAAPEGVNVWWETTREPDFDLAVGALARRGRLILMAGREARPPFPVGPFYVKGCSMHGFAMFTFSADEQRIWGTDINRWMAEGKLKARIDRVLPLAEAALAHRLQEESTVGKTGALAGKIVLKP